MNYCKYLVKHCCVNNFTLWNKLHQICHFLCSYYIGKWEIQIESKIMFHWVNIWNESTPTCMSKLWMIKTISLPVIHYFWLWYNLITMVFLRQTFVFSHLCIRMIPSSPHFVKIYCTNFSNICKKREMMFWQHHSRYKLRLKPQLI